MTPIERFNFVVWAQQEFPGFTTNPVAYEQAARAWVLHKELQQLTEALTMAKSAINNQGETA
jgi:hypothetical protein